MPKLKNILWYLQAGNYFRGAYEKAPTDGPTLGGFCVTGAVGAALSTIRYVSPTSALGAALTPETIATITGGVGLVATQVSPYISHLYESMAKKPVIPSLVESICPAKAFKSKGTEPSWVEAPAGETLGSLLSKDVVAVWMKDNKIWVKGEGWVDYARINGMVSQ